jgi:hypothetical protein
MVGVHCSAEPSVVFQWTLDECAESSVMRNLISDLDQQQPIGVDACSGQELTVLTALVKRLSSTAADADTLAYLAGLEQPELLVHPPPLWIEEELRRVVTLSPILQLSLYLDMPRISAILSDMLARKSSAIH